MSHNIIAAVVIVAAVLVGSAGYWIGRYYYSPELGERRDSDHLDSIRTGYIAIACICGILGLAGSITVAAFATLRAWLLPSSIALAVVAVGLGMLVAGLGSDKRTPLTDGVYNRFLAARFGELMTKLVSVIGTPYLLPGEEPDASLPTLDELQTRFAQFWRELTAYIEEGKGSASRADLLALEDLLQECSSYRQCSAIIDPDPTLSDADWQQAFDEFVKANTEKAGEEWANNYGNYLDDEASGAADACEKAEPGDQTLDSQIQRRQHFADAYYTHRARVDHLGAAAAYDQYVAERATLQTVEQ